MSNDWYTIESMLAEDKINLFLRLQQIILDIDDSSKIIKIFLPTLLKELLAANYSYNFLSAIFTDLEKLKSAYFIDEKLNFYEGNLNGIIDVSKILQKGTSWESSLFFGKEVILSDATLFLHPNFIKNLKVNSLLIVPILNIKKLSGILILGTVRKAEKITKDEVEFVLMLTRLLDLAYRLEDTQNSLTNITKEVYQMNAKLHLLDKLKDDFVSVASHELRTPMTAIRSYVWMALHKSDIPLSQKLERYLYRTLVSTERLINLVNDMLNVSRIEAGKIEVTPKSFDIVSLSEDIMEEVRPKADEKHLVLNVIAQKMPPVFADPDKVHQILLNLIGHSLKFTYPGGNITASFFTDGKVVDVSIKDNGAGISSDDMNKLFHKFSRLDNSYTSVSTSGGTGLGLYISKNLVELMHGRIWATSEGVDKGSVFNISLPVANAEVLAHVKDYEIKVDGDAKPLESVAI